MSDAKDEKRLAPPIGRPTKLTPERQELILKAIRLGSYACVAARYAGIDERTYYNWMERGERDAEGIFFQFFQAVKSAEAQAEIEAVELVKLSMPDNWQAAMTYLERRHPERWRRRDELNFRHISDADLIREAAGALARNAPPWLEIPDGEREPEPLPE